MHVKAASIAPTAAPDGRRIAFLRMNAAADARLPRSEVFAGGVRVVDEEPARAQTPLEI